MIETDSCALSGLRREKAGVGSRVEQHVERALPVDGHIDEGEALAQRKFGSVARPEGRHREPARHPDL